VTNVVARRKKNTPEVPDLKESELARQYSGYTPEELNTEVQRLDARIELLHLDENGRARVLTASQREEFDILISVRDYVMSRVEAHANARRSIARSGLPHARAYQGLRDVEEFYSDSVFRISGQQARSMAKRSLEMNGKRLSADQADRVAKLIGDEENEDQEESYIARRILLTETPPYRSAWKRLMTETHPLLTNEEIEAVRAFEKFDRMEARAMAESPTSAGGFGIPVFIDPSIILTAQGSSNPFLEVAKVAEINTNAWKGVTSAGVTWSFQAEGATVGDNAPALGQPVVTVFMARGFIPFSIEVGMDYPDFANEMAVLLASGYDELLVDKFTRGSGTLEPMGIITALDADTNSEVRLTTAGAFAEVDFYKVWKQLPQRFRRNASWMMSVDVNNAIRRFGTSVGIHAFTENLVGGWVDRLMNRQVFEGAYFPDNVATTGSWNQLVVGDFRNYVIARRGGMNVELIPTLFDITNNRPTGQRGWFAFARCGGAPAQNAAFRLLNQT
jgi:HK97 family phage major capsid protein